MRMQAFGLAEVGIRLQYEKSRIYSREPRWKDGTEGRKPRTGLAGVVVQLVDARNTSEGKLLSPQWEDGRSRSKLLEPSSRAARSSWLDERKTDGGGPLAP